MGGYNRTIPEVVSGIVFLLLGGILGVESLLNTVTGVSLMVEFAEIDRGAFFPQTMGNAVVLILSVLLVLSGGSKEIRAIRFWKIKNVLKDRELVSLKELESRLHYSERKLRLELEKMIQHRLFLQGHINSEFTCFITTDRKYQEYLKVTEAWKEEQKRWEEKGFDEEKQRIIKEAQQCLEKINQSVRFISERENCDPVFAEDLRRLGKKIESLIMACRQNPENLPGMSMFLDYYLPTAEKFAKEYVHILQIGETGENVRTLQKEIPEGVRVLADAFEQMTIRLCERMRIDIYQEIDMLEELMEQNSGKKRAI